MLSVLFHKTQQYIPAGLVPYLQSMTSPPRGITVGGGATIPYDPNVRTIFNDTGAVLYGWPSRGGVIILDPALPVDLDFLHLNPLDPPSDRLDDQEAEDAFCQQLLLLGAKWWDSEARSNIVYAIEKGGGHPGSEMQTRGVDGAFRIEEQPPPTMREKRVVRVGWPESGGLWVAEYDTTWAGVDEEDKLCDEDLGRVAMCRSMEERCRVLKEWFGAKFYTSLEQYEGYAFLRAWEWKREGEAGKLLTPEETVELWRRVRRERD